MRLSVDAAWGTTIRADPEFTYMDIARGQYLAVRPACRRADWRVCAEASRKTFDDTLGARATSEARRRIGAKRDLRVVFGWAALVEKPLARQLGIDDRVREVAKLAVMRTREEASLPSPRELRLLAEVDGDLVLAWVDSTGKSSGALRVPRQLIVDVECDDVGEGDVVDFQREMPVV